MINDKSMLEKHYESMKRQGRCPYDSFGEYLNSIVGLSCLQTEPVTIVDPEKTKKESTHERDK